jgi:4-amino-4-deoxy-L-arabinose transferase-like glycosyltransferase
MQLEANRKLRWLFLGLTLALSAYIQFTVVHRTVTDTPVRADSKRYFSYAYNLVHSRTYSDDAIWNGEASVAVPDAIVSPGYPLFLAAIPGLKPADVFLLRVERVQAFLGVLSVLLAYLIGRRIMSAGGALATALLTALSPHLATISTYMLTESLFTFLLLASIQASLYALRSGRRGPLLLAGATWGLCSMVRPTMQFLPPLFVLAALLLPSLRKQLKPALLVLAAFLAVQAPWTVRNQLLPADAPSESLMVKFLLHGSYPNFMFEDKPASYGYPYAFDPDSAGIRDLPAVLGRIAGNFAAHPLKYAHWYLIGKPGAFLSWGIVNGFGDIYTYPPVHSPYLENQGFALVRLAMFWLHWPLMLLGLAGAALACWRPQVLGLDDQRRFQARLLAAIVFYAIAFHMVGAPFPRYAIPFRPLLFLFAVLVLTRARSPRSESAREQSVPA